MSIMDLPGKIRFFVHPLPLSVVAIMAINDHWLKYRYANFLTGKLSDFCGVFYFPIFILAMIICLDEILRLKRLRLQASTVISVIVFTDCLLLLVKLSAVSARGIEAFFFSYLFPIRIIQDPTDLVALLVNPLTYFYMRGYFTSKVT